ncbi:ribosome small subunit-dependent GTPase A [Hylemonella gracilis]|uniref:ribosome small subunit-dependent GTPase A n=1 Tax=Hylemonella gracilis TaxID=80880 RepID=UPI000550977E|nr:ribosome small subunit-dependent GTPase A [Hylemonella gracilis]
MRGPGRAATAAQALASGLVVASHGRHLLVESPEGPDGRRLICHPRGKKNDAVVGDRVRWLPTGDEGSIEAIEPRRNLFHRQDELRSKSFAANIDQVLILIAAEPEFSESQLARALIAAEAAGIPPLIALNKSDLSTAHARAWARLAAYRRMGYTVLPLNLKSGATQDSVLALRQHLRGRATLVLGPSGAGKSTLINLFAPGAQAQTGEISSALNSGKHTTTHTRWYWVQDPQANDVMARTALIDSPGFQEFGLHHIEAAQLARLMPDLRVYADSCRFYNCTHLHEPGCAVIAAVEPTGEPATGPRPEPEAPMDLTGADPPVTSSRYRIYRELHAELSMPPRY